MELSKFTKDCLDLIDKHSKKIDLSFISRYSDPYNGKNGLLFIFGDKRAELYDDGFMKVRKFIAGNGDIYADYVTPENLIKTLEKLCQQK